MVSVFTSSAVDRGFEPKTKIGICCFSVMHTPLRSKSKDWLAQNRDRILCPSGASCLPVDSCSSHLRVTCSHHDIVEKSSIGVKEQPLAHFSCITFFSHSYRCMSIRVITKLPNSEQSYKGKIKTHNYINRQNQSTTGKLWKP
jgi:hypothetical protein